MDHFFTDIFMYIKNIFVFLTQTDNRFLIAGIDTLFVPAVLILLGLFIGTITDALTALFVKTFGKNIAFFLRNYLTYPGTIHHELSHALLALLTGAKVKKITLIPRGQELGSATFLPVGNRLTKSLQLTLSSIAPVICGTTSLSLLIIYVWPLCQFSWQYILLGYFLISILLHMNLSNKDVQVAKKGLPICMIILYLIFLIWNIHLPALLLQQFLQLHIPKLF